MPLQKPRLRLAQLSHMNTGIFGIPDSFGLPQSAVNPVDDIPDASPGSDTHLQPGQVTYRPFNSVAHRCDEHGFTYDNIQLHFSQ